jgi:hypothetical protein
MNRANPISIKLRSKPKRGWSKYLIRTSDDTLSSVDVALGYKQLYQLENAFRTLKTTLALRPVYITWRPHPLPYPALLASPAAGQSDGEPD